jgi:putative DNA primase/helicase
MKGLGIRTPKQPKNPKHTDLANAALFLDHHGQNVRYNREWGKWLAWDQTRWVICPDQSDPTERASETMKLAEAKAREESNKSDLDWAISSQSKARISAMMSLASASKRLVVDTNALDSDPWILNTANGMLDLHAGEHWKKQHTRPYKHIRETLCTKSVSVRYNEYAKCPLWDAFLYRAMGGNEDMVDLLRRIAGYSLTGTTSEQALFFFYGEGANGKSTFLSVLRRLLGEYAIPAPRGLLEAEHNDDHATRLAALYRVRLVIGSEVEAGKHLAESMVKDLTGGEQIAARRMREDYWYFEPTHKIIMQGNHRPIIVGQDEGIWRRMKVVPWSVCIPEKERDPDLVEKLMVELPGILRWAVEGCLAWQTDGLGLRSDLLEEAVREYRDEQKIKGRIIELIGEFFEACIEKTSGQTVARSVVRRAFEQWLRINGFPYAVITDDLARTLAGFLTHKGVMETRAGVGADRERGWRGIVVKVPSVSSDKLDS